MNEMRKGAHAQAWAFLGACLHAAACTQGEVPATQVVVLVSADEEVAAGVSQVTAKLYPADAEDEDGDHPFQSLPFDLKTESDAARVGFPFSFGIAKGSADRFLLVVEGYNADVDEAVIEWKAIVSFRSGQTLLLNVGLSNACYLATCSGLNKTCKRGDCGPVENAILQPFDAGAELVDGSMTGGAPADAGIDAAVDSGDGSAPPNRPPPPPTCETDAVTCHANAHCEDHDGPDCVCDSGYESAENGECRNIDDCPGNGCKHGSCVDAVNGYSCDCKGSGFEGARCSEDIDECASNTSCSADYPCVQTVPPGFACRGQLADWRMPVVGSKVPPSYDTTTIPDVVIDNVTGLVWQRNLPSSDACSSLMPCSWSAAKKYCEELILAAQTDWRLPTKIELESIIDETRFEPAISEAFPSTPAFVFWSASPSVSTSGSVYVIDFKSGQSMDGSALDGRYLARCVRRPVTPIGSGTPLDRYRTDQAAGTVTDARTDLVWERAPTFTGTFAEARDYCSKRGSNWRLPALKELLTLVDLGRVKPTIDPAFAGVDSSPSTYYWTGSKMGPSAMWGVSFYDGKSSGLAPDTAKTPVRCVQ